MCDFDRLFSFDSYWLNFTYARDPLNFTCEHLSLGNMS